VTSDETEQGSVLPKDPAQRKEERAYFIHIVSNAPGVPRILVTGIASIVVVLGMTAAHRFWIAALTAVVFLVLFTINQVVYAAISWSKNARIEELQEGWDACVQELKRRSPPPEPPNSAERRNLVEH
jgi:hypothetical protein